jgi:hypothetical protein
METKIKKDWLGRVKSVEELHHDTLTWKSEINFIIDEMRFLEHLLSSKYINFIHSGLYKKIEISLNKITDEKNSGKVLIRLILDQERILSNLIKNESDTSNKNFLEKHHKFKVEMVDYVKKYKRIKKQFMVLLHLCKKNKNLLDLGQKVGQIF